jgi:ParB family chromosome partitioning protein
VSAVYLLLAFGLYHPVRIDVHPCIAGCGALESKPKAFTAVHAETSRLLSTVAMKMDEHSGTVVGIDATGTSAVDLFRAVQVLSDEDLDGLTALLVLLSFGQRSIEELDDGESLFNRVAADLNIMLRDWWTPGAEFFALMRKDQLEAVAIESGASLRMGKLKDYSKKDLVSALARQFERTADPWPSAHSSTQKLFLPSVEKCE